MKQKTMCKIKIAVSSILFLLSFTFLGASLKCLFFYQDISYLPLLVIYVYIVCDSAKDLVKNALKAGYIQFMEEKDDVEHK